MSEPVVLHAERVAPREAPSIEVVLRPLMLATVGTGVMVLGLMQFGADLMAQVDDSGRTLMVRGIRTAFFAFLGTSSALLAAYLCKVDRSRRLTALFNVYGMLIFVGGVWLSGGTVGGALSRVPGVVVAMPSAVAIFFLVSVGGAAALAVSALARIAIGAARRRVDVREAVQ